MPGPVGEVWGVRSQIGRETTPGVVAPATRITYLQEPVLQDTSENRFHDFATGTRDQTLEVTATPKVVEGRVALPLSSEEMLEWLSISVNGNPTVTTPTGAATTRDHIYIPGDPASASLELDDGARQWVGLGVRGNTLRIAGNVREDNIATLDLFATDLIAQSVTVGPLGRNPSFFTGRETRIYIGAFGADPSAFDSIPGLLINWDLNFGFNLGRKYTADNTLAATAIPSGVVTAAATFTFEAIHPQSLTEFMNHRNATKLAVRLEFGNNRIIENNLTSLMWIDLPGAWLSKDLGGTDEGTRTYEFRYRYVRDNTQGYPYRIIARTDRVAAF